MIARSLRSLVLSVSVMVIRKTENIPVILTDTIKFNKKHWLNKYWKMEKRALRCHGESTAGRSCFQLCWYLRSSEKGPRGVGTSPGRAPDFWGIKEITASWLLHIWGSAEKIGYWIRGYCQGEEWGWCCQGQQGNKGVRLFYLSFPLVLPSPLATFNRESAVKGEIRFLKTQPSMLTK